MLLMPCFAALRPPLIFAAAGVDIRSKLRLMLTASHLKHVPRIGMPDLEEREREKKEYRTPS